MGPMKTVMAASMRTLSSRRSAAALVSAPLRGHGAVSSGALSRTVNQDLRGPLTDSVMGSMRTVMVASMKTRATSWCAVGSAPARRAGYSAAVMARGHGAVFPVNRVKTTGAVMGSTMTATGT